MSRLLLSILLALLAAPATSQDKKEPEKKKEPPPKVLYAMPLVVKPVEKQKLALRGQGLAAVKEVTVTGADDAKVKVLGAKAVPVPANYPGDRVGDSEVEVELELPKGARSGAVKLTAVGPGGDSNAYALLIRDELTTVSEKEPNDGFEQAQKVEVPAAIEGTIKSERDVDVFRFEGKKGERLRIEVQAGRFGSPLDPFVVVYDPSRAVVDSADDTDGGPDPALKITLPKDGTFYISVIDAHDLGGPNFGYRFIVTPEK